MTTPRRFVESSICTVPTCTRTVPAPYLHRTCTDTEPVVKPLGLLLEGFEDNGKRASRRDPFVGRNRIWGSSSP